MLRHPHNVAVACLLLAGCPDPVDEVPADGSGDSGSDSGTTMPPSTTPPGDSTTTEDPDPDTGSSGDTSTPETTTGDETTTGGECPPGTEGCPCDGGACDGELVCVGDNCVMPGACGDGVVDEGEECDDGNAVPDDGCEDDCTFTPGAAAVELGEVHTCVLLNRGAVRCWGDGTSGRLGYGNTNDIGDDEEPATAGDVDLGGFVVQIAVGSNFNCARFDNGDVKCWGFNGQGQLGLGHTANVGDSLLPSAFPDVELGGPAADISAGLDHACAVLETGDVYCWGNNNSGQLGYGNAADIGDDEDPLDAGAVALGAPAVDVEAAGTFTCAVLDTGDLKCWGDAVSGVLGYGNEVDVGDDELPDAVGTVDLGGALVMGLSGGADHVCARTDADELFCWGEAGLGRLGYGNTNDIGDDEAPVSAGPVSLGGAVMQVGVGSTHSCAVTTANEVRCWGEATHGRLGNGDANLDVGDNELPTDVPIVAVGAQVVQVAGGLSHTCAVLSGGAVKCWGRSNQGQLGYGNTASIGDDELPNAVGNVVIE